ncbi:MAG: N-6 DNA methylase [Mollicutes bacterium]|nr:N-6 DNA methylase [Mollicutes bacterium]MCI7797546.1 N-6 DNA methylase [Mollicutes bacterium]
MTDLEQKKKAKEFAEFWKDKGYEKGQSQIFWTTLLTNVFGVENISEFIEFEDQVHIDKTTGFIDGYIPSTKVLIEQKSIEKDLRKPIKQSDGSLLNPFQQAKKYIAELPVSKHPKWVITCNFKSFLVYDMNNPNSEPEEILLKNLPKEVYRLSFLVDEKSEHLKKEEELSFKAGELVGKLYDAFSKQYKDITNEQSQKDLNELCVRLVFCLYAEDAGLFGRKNVFHDYLNKYDDLGLMRKSLIELFKVLDTKLEDRDPYLDEELNQFPYVNGGLFSNENIEIPLFTDEIKNTLLAKASDDFDWSEISPTIFGAVFESTLNPETRRSGGMHYTSIENIHKVIDPLFLNELREKLDDALAYKNEKTRNEKLIEFQNYIASLNFLDPACGSGNFLTETYLSLRRLENEMLSAMSKGMMMLDIADTIKVSIQQFYGIEINDFAVKVAKTALWIAEAQMCTETKKIISSFTNISDFLPLETYDNIVEENALRIDWNEIISNTKCNYIMGNPPFVGARLMSPVQKEDVAEIFKNIKNYGNIDYVGCWYVKAANYMKNTSIETALVSTNSICQGEQTTILWKDMLNNGININFAYRTFRWDSEASLKAHVHCIIIGFSYKLRDKRIIYDNGKFNEAKNINAYLVDAPNVLLDSRSNPICNVSKADFGSMPNDNGFLSDYSKEQVLEINTKYPESENMFKLFIGATEFLHKKERYCLWLKGISPTLIKKVPPVYEAVEKVKELRNNSNREATRKLADIPMLFGEIRQPDGDYLVIPCHSSEKRRYIPVGYVDKNVICSNANILVPNANLYSFGVLMSNVHNSWMRIVSGRIKSDYRYSVKIVYNNFPWPNPTKEQKEKIEKTAQAILDARELYPDSSLADLYDELTMPVELRKAHQANDVAVMEAYGFNWKTMTESMCVAELMKMYQKLVKDN